MSTEESRLRIRIEEFEQRQRALAKELVHVGFIWPGSICVRTLTCGKKTCACHEDPAVRHGPYVLWSTKKAGKTVGRVLRGEEAEVLREWVENRQKLDRIAKEMRRLSTRALKTMVRARSLQGRRA